MLNMHCSPISQLEQGQDTGLEMRLRCSEVTMRKTGGNKPNTKRTRCPDQAGRYVAGGAG
jgi:hypothetical protein